MYCLRGLINKDMHSEKARVVSSREKIRHAERRTSLRMRMEQNHDGASLPCVGACMA